MRYLLFSGNSGVFDGVLTCLLSVLKRTKTEEPVGTFLLTMDVSRIKPQYTPIGDRETEFLQSVARKYNPGNFVKKIDVTDLYEREFGGCPNEGAYCSPYTLLRLFADELPEIDAEPVVMDAVPAPERAAPEAAPAVDAAVVETAPKAQPAMPEGYEPINKNKPTSREWC